MLEDVVFEVAAVDNAEQILALQQTAYVSEAEIYGDFRIPPLLETLDEMRQSIGTQLVLKATCGGQIVGSVRAIVEGDSCFIGRLIVHPDYQNQGLGTQLLGRVELCCAEVGRYELFTGERSVRNLHLYEKLGYRKFKREVLSDRVTLVFLEKNGKR